MMLKKVNERYLSLIAFIFFSNDLSIELHVLS